MTYLLFVYMLLYQPVWKHSIPYCPKHYDVWVDESLALQGKDGAICVRTGR